MIFELLLLLTWQLKYIDIQEFSNINNFSLEKSIENIKEKSYLKEQEDILNKFDIQFINKSDLKEEVFNKKIQIVKNVLTMFLITLKDTSSFNWLEISFTNFLNKNVRWKFWIYWNNKKKIQLNRNLDNIMIATTLTHELWHQLTYLISESEKNKFWKKCFVNKYAWTSKREDIAETFTYFINSKIEDWLTECIQEKFKVYQTLFNDQFNLYYDNCQKLNSCFQTFENYEEQIKWKKITSSYLYWIEWFKITTTNKLFNIKSFD